MGEKKRGRGWGPVGWHPAQGCCACSLPPGLQDVQKAPRQNQAKGYKIGRYTPQPVSSSGGKL